MSFSHEELQKLLNRYGLKIEIRTQREELIYVVYKDLAFFDSEEEIYDWIVREYDNDLQ